MAKKEEIEINPKKLLSTWWVWGIIALVSYFLIDLGIFFGYLTFLALILFLILSIVNLTKYQKNHLKQMGQLELLKKIYSRLGWIIFWLVIIALILLGILSGIDDLSQWIR